MKDNKFARNTAAEAMLNFNAAIASLCPDTEYIINKSAYFMVFINI